MPIAIGAPVTRRVILDMSSYQPIPDFSRIPAEVVGVIIKVSQGEWSGSNPNFEGQYAAAHAAGKAVGGYLFDDTSVAPSVESDIYLSKVAGKEMPLGHWLDFEANNGGLSPAAVSAHCQGVMGALNYAYPGKAGVYTAPWAWGPWTGNADFSTYPLWLAGYTPSLPPSPSHWGLPLLWQYTDSYPCYFGKCDASLFMGTDAQWDAWTSTTEDDMTPEQANQLKTIAGAVYQMAMNDAKNNAALNAKVDKLTTELEAMKAAQGPGNTAILEAVKAVPAGTGGTVDPAAIVAAIKQAQLTIS